MLRENSKRRPREEKSTEARRRDGMPRSSEEGFVMDVERRGHAIQLKTKTNRRREESMDSTKPFCISKHVVLEAWKRVKENRGAAGIDDESVEKFESDLKNNLYKLWNRMSSGTYIPPPVRVVEIPKKGGGIRRLGVPTISDRIAQTVVQMTLEPGLEPLFHEDSYGYRPGKSAIQAVGVTRERCWRYDWVLEFDIRGAFDNIDHELLLRALRKHTDCKWVLLYVERWLVAPFQFADGRQEQRAKGTPQGGVVSPLLMNLFLHYVFDRWMSRHYPEIRFARYADDGVCHCKTEAEAQKLKSALTNRFAACKLELHPDKTQIVYCKDADRRGEYEHTSFDFLGFTFCPRRSKNRWGKYFVNFTPAVSSKASKAMRQKTRSWRLHLRSDKSLEDLSNMFNPILQGWVNYFKHFYKSAMTAVFRHLDEVLVRWAMRKYKRLRRHRRRAAHWLGRIARKEPRLFVHWKMGIRPAAG
jgi:RNA-directed DNA polymerase